MFSLLKRKLKEFEDRDYEKRLKEYEQYVQRLFDEKSNKIALNASIGGRDCIQEKMIFFTSEIRILCKNRKSIFSDNILNLIEIISSEKKITVITFDGERDEFFENLSKKNENFKYYAAKCNNPEETTEYILADKQMFWLSSNDRYGFLEIVAKFSFNNIATTIKHWKMFDEILEKLKK